MARRRRVSASEAVLKTSIGKIHWISNSARRPASYFLLAKDKPKATESHTVEDLETMGLFGWYAVVRDGAALFRDGTWRRWMPPAVL